MRRLVSRLLLLGLAAAVIVAVVRLGDGGGEAIVDVDQPGAGTLRHQAFEVLRPARVAIDAAGSFEDAPPTPGADTAMAAYGWLVRRTDGAVVWRLGPGAVRRGHGTLATRRDTLALTPGVYDAYFASYGDPDFRAAVPAARSFGDRFRRLLSRDGRAWLGDAGRWRLRLTAVPGDQDAFRATSWEDMDARPDEARLLWASGPAEGGGRQEWLFEVREPAALRLHATGALADGHARDRAFIERLGGAPDTVWALAAHGSTWAGGARRNRRAEAALRLAPGVYRASFLAAEGGGWTANPPFIPAAWGLTLAAADAAAQTAVGALDPWARLPRIAEFTCVGPDADLRTTFTLPDTTAVLIHAEGEVSGSTVYDGARLHRQVPGRRPELVWELAPETARPAGGADKNQAAEAALTLAPGTYVLGYYSDGSHDCTNFNAEEPDAPERWGATLFALDPAFDRARVTVQRDPKLEGEDGGSEEDESEDDEVPAVAGAPEAPEAPEEPAGAVLVRMDRLANNALVTQTFTLSRPAPVRIYAIGELVPSERLDYGWLTDASGATIWEMTRANTRAAGGSQKNRRFDGRLDLPAGTYTVHFRTSPRHAYGAFVQPPPGDPEAWGIRVERLGGG